MNCPACRHSGLIRMELDEHLMAYECSACHGHWISSRDYFYYLDKKSEILPEKAYDDIEPDHQDSLQAKICADCGGLLTKFRVGHGIDFYLDYCGKCQGVWLDHNEWQSLKNRNLHDEINRIFTTKWQNQLRAEHVQQHLDRIYRERLGDDFERVQQFRAWLTNHPQESLIRAYLRERI